MASFKDYILTRRLRLIDKFCQYWISTNRFEENPSEIIGELEKKQFNTKLYTYKIVYLVEKYLNLASVSFIIYKLSQRFALVFKADSSLSMSRVPSEHRRSRLSTTSYSACLSKFVKDPAPLQHPFTQAHKISVSMSSSITLALNMARED